MKSIKFLLFLSALFLNSHLSAQNINQAANGLTKSGSTVLLGGTLNNAQTSIDFGSSNSSSNFLFRKGASNYFFIDNSGNIAIGHNAPTAKLHTTGTVRFQGLTTNNTLTNILVADANGNLAWRDASTLGGGGGGSGTVTSVGLTMPSGFSIAGSPITTSGTSDCLKTIHTCS